MKEGILPQRLLGFFDQVEFHRIGHTAVVAHHEREITRCGHARLFIPEFTYTLRQALFVKMRYRFEQRVLFFTGVLRAEMERQPALVPGVETVIFLVRKDDLSVYLVVEVIARPAADLGGKGACSVGAFKEELIGRLVVGDAVVKQDGIDAESRIDLRHL